MQLTKFAKFSWGVLAWTILVILWGAVVRATGSGAGCGSHWPTCKGEIIHRPEAVETLIELSHRATSGVALILVLILLIWAFRAYPKGHLVRKGATATAAFILIEALLGAGLVSARTGRRRRFGSSRNCNGLAPAQHIHPAGSHDPDCLVGFGWQSHHPKRKGQLAALVQSWVGGRVRHRHDRGCHRPGRHALPARIAGRRADP
jgi:hypothetical protein